MPPRPLLYRRFGPALLGLVLGLGLPQPGAAQEMGDAGAFLAARTASSHADYAAAASWYARALISDPQNPELLEGAILANIGLGEFEPAAHMARVLQAQQVESEVAILALLVEAIRTEDYATALKLSEKGAKSAALLDSLVAGWSQVGLGQMSEATQTFDALSKAKGAEAFGLYHKALALASAGDFEGADAILSGKASGPLPLMRRGVLAHAQVLSQLERNADALTLLNDRFNTEPDPEIDTLRRRLTAGEPVPYDIVTTPQQGLAEVFHTLAIALDQEGDATHTLIYARAAQALRPDQAETALFIASLLERQGQHDLAISVFASIPAESPMSHIAEIGRAEANYAAGRKDAAIEVLLGLTRAQPKLLAGHVALADAYRRDERFAEGRAAYDAAIALLPSVQPEHWALFFSRGICAERLQDFDAMVADMREALRLNPDQPQVLNYLGYSFVDRGENLEEALGMIERAVAAEPGSGYIIDSLAWAYFRLGRHQDAVAPMEQASLLEPVDPIVTDHLGDVYWAVGRTREAQFQWHRALSYGPEEKDAVRIRAKLEKGLDAVLAEEGAKPLTSVEAKADQ